MQNHNLINYESFGEWELKKKLGTGGFGDVLLWVNRNTNQHIATKTLKENPRLGDDEVKKLKERWQQEYDWMQALDTEYIVRGILVTDVAFVSYMNEQHAWRPLPVIFMEYCNGGDMRAQLQQIENINGLHEYVVRDVLHALRHAIEYLHKTCKIKHRDLKPDNIVIHRNERSKPCYKLTDFGFARHISDKTMLESMVGTHNYFAPEIVNTAKYTNTVDYWSLGVIAFELMCGTLPFIPHQGPCQVITNIQKKPADCIAITEEVPASKDQYQFHSHIFAEHRLSSVFVEQIEVWLRIALDKNYKTRGTVAETSEDGLQRPNAPRILKFYTTLDETLQTKILTVFCLNTYKFHEYEVTPELSMDAMFEAFANDTGLEREKHYLVLPAGHPCKQLTSTTRPIDLYVAQWQMTDECLTQPVMLYLLGYQCDYDASEPQIPAVVKKCLKCTKEQVPDWFAQKFAQHTHFLLSNEQRHLEALLNGLHEYAMTVEHDILNFDVELHQLLAEITLMQGSSRHFSVMINAAREANNKKLNGNGAFYEKWLATANEINCTIENTDQQIGLCLKKRYSSAVRRIKELATKSLYNDLQKKDIFALAEFRDQLAMPHGKNIQKRMQECEKTVYNCLNERNKFLHNPQLKYCKSEIAEIHIEFITIKSIVYNTRAMLAKLNAKINDDTLVFQTNLLEECARHGYDAVDSNSQMQSLKSASAQNSLNNGMYSSEWNSIMSVPTVELVQEAMETLKLMSMDVDDESNVSDIPATIMNFKDVE